MTGSLSKTIIYLCTVVLGQLISFLLLPIITRTLSPSVYGEYALALTIFNLVGVFGSSWIRNVSFRLYFDEKFNGSTACFYFNSSIFQFLLVSILIFGIIPLVQLSPFKFDSSLILLAAGASIIFNDFFSLTLGLIRAENLTNNFAVTEIAYGLVRLCVTIVGIFIGYKTPTFLFICTIISSIVASCLGIYFLKQKLSGGIKLNKKIMKNITILGLSSIPLSIGGWVMALSDRMFLKFYSDSYTVGIYSVAYSLGDRLIGGLVSATFMMAWPNIMDDWNSGGESGATKAINNSLKLFIWLTIGPLFFIFFANEKIILLIAGKEYLSSSEILPIIALSSWISGLITYINRPIELVKNYKLMSKITILAAATNLIFNILLIPSNGAIGAAISTLIAYFISLIFFIYNTNRSMINFPVKHLFGSIFFSYLAVTFIKISTNNIFYCISIFVVIYFSGIMYFYLNNKFRINTI